jgi:hypothetical protein
MCAILRGVLVCLDLVGPLRQGLWKESPIGWLDTVERKLKCAFEWRNKPRLRDQGTFEEMFLAHADVFKLCKSAARFVRQSCHGNVKKIPGSIPPCVMRIGVFTTIQEFIQLSV